MLDPVKIAKPYGAVVFLLFGLLEVLSPVFSLYTSENRVSEIDLLSLVFGMVGMISGYGLYKTKVWGIYALGILALLKVLGIFYDSSNGYDISTGSLISPLLLIVPFLVFFLVKNKFKG